MSSLDVRAIDETGLRKQPSPKVTQGFRIMLSERAFDRAVERGASDTSREIGGVLVGELLRDDAGPYVHIEDTVDALHADEKGAELTFTHATWEHINKEMDTRHAGKQIVGWYHTHPGFGVFLSDRDQFIHKSFFNLPFQVAFVYDPKSRECGMFAWHENEAVRTRRYWIGAREQLWDGPRTQERADDVKISRDAAKAADARAPADRAGEEPPLGIAGLITGAVIMLLIGGFLGHFLASWSASGELNAARIAIASAKQDGAQAALGSLQADLVGLLRETLGDAAVQKPVAAALADLDAVIPTLEGTGSGSAAGSTDDRARLLSIAKTLREQLVRLSQDRGSAQAALAQLELAARRNSGDSRDLSHDVAEDRAGLGALYAELAVDVAKTDKARAHRLLAMAARLDPGNRARYEKQLQSFDPKSSLPAEPPHSAGAGDMP